MKTNLKFPLTIAILLSLLIIGMLLVSQIRPLTVFSVSNIKIEPDGYEDETTREWKGTFWVISMITDCTDEIATYKFDKTVSDDYGQDKDGDKKLIPSATIEIRIDPEQPYWERPLEVHSYNVYPKTWGAWRDWFNMGSYGKVDDDSVESLDVDVWQFGTDYWTLHTPFKVSVYKNGELIGESGIIDTVGGVETLRVPTSGEEHITIQNLGKIGTGYTEPTFNVLMFSESTVFEYSDDLINKIRYDVDDYSYSNYWWGGGNVYKCENWNPYETAPAIVERWDDETKSPSHSYSNHGMLVQDYEFPGTYSDNTDLAYVLKVIGADIWEDKHGGNVEPYGKSLVNYLKQYHNTINLNVWNQGFKIEDSKLKVNLPFGSMSSLITIKISSELADTIVWSPQVGNFKITEFNEIGNIPDRKFGYIKVKQFSDVDSSGTVALTVSPSNLPVDVNPVTIGTGTMTLGEETTLIFELTNLGTDTERDGTLTATVTNSIGSVTDEKTVDFKLLKKGAGNTVLTVYTIEKTSREYISGVSLTINWEGGSTTGITSEGSWSYDFGAVHPFVTVTSAETPTYKSASDSKQLEVGPNSITLELLLQGEEPPIEIPWIWVILIMVIVASGLIVYVLKSKKGMRRK